jgi:hypothetical protein
MKKTVITFFTILLFFSALFASFGPEVSKYNGKDLKWMDGGTNYLVMFKSNLDKDYNCVDESEFNSYSLDETLLPPDAIVERAFLVWTGTVPINKKDEPTDGEVELHFTSKYGDIQHSATISANPGTVTKPRGFDFDSVKQSEFNIYHYVYRVDITSFFNAITEKADELEAKDYYYFGNYSVTGIDCYKDEAHPEAIISDWSIVVIYYSKYMSGKNIYIYDNFQILRNDYLESELTVLEMSRDPLVQMTFINHLGNHGIPSVPDINSGKRVSEGIWIKGSSENWLTLEDKCNTFYAADNNFTTLDYTDIFNSISSLYGWSDDEPYCIGGEQPLLDTKNIEQNIEADTFIMSASTDVHYAAHFNPDTTEIMVKYGANTDDVLTDMIIISTDKLKPPYIDYPVRELVACTPCAEKGDCWCESDLEYTFAIRLQNQGHKSAEELSIETSIPEYMEYVENSTEFATDFIEKDGYLISDKWTQIPDNENGEFPLKEKKVVLDELKPYYQDEGVKTIFVRYRTKLKDGGRIKSMIIESIAKIGMKGSPEFLTNTGYPLKLTFSDNCFENPEDINMSECGGSTEDAETPDEYTDFDNDDLTNDIDKKDDGCAITLI